MRSARLCLVVTALGLVLWAPSAHASNGVELYASINGRPVSSGTNGNPIDLHPRQPTTLDVRVDNQGSGPIVVHGVRLEGRVMGVTFYELDTEVDFEVPAGEIQARDFQVDLGDLSGQAVGLIPSSVTILDGGHRPIATEGTLVDVEGSWHSIYAEFALAVALVTVLLFIGLLVGVARHRLKPNRLWRAFSFMPFGIGLALTIVFLLSAAAVTQPGVALATPALLFCGAGSWAFGFLSPSPDDEVDIERDLLERRDLDDEPGGPVPAKHALR